MVLSDFFSQLHYIVVEITLLVLLILGAYKLIRMEFLSVRKKGKHGTNY